MEASTARASAAGLRARRRGALDRAGDFVLRGITGLAAIGAVVLVGLLAYKIVQQAWPAISKFGLGFVTSRAWDPVTDHYGALNWIFGTAVTSFCAVLLAAPLSIGIGLYLSELAPRGIRGVIASLVEMLAAIPSVVLGLWGILVMGPFVQNHLEPWLHRTFGFIPLFRGEPSGVGLLPAILVLTIMVIPITASICRELFLSVPTELEDGAIALGATRWETVRGVVLPYTRAGVTAAVILGLGRAIGEAIAVTQVIGSATAATGGIHWSLFAPGDTLASRIASQYQGASSHLLVASIAYLAVVLLAISLVTNLVAQLIVRRFELQRTGGG